MQSNAANPELSGALRREEIGAFVREALDKLTVIDMHTHLFKPSLGRLGLWGIDQLLTYHYLEAEFFRSSTMQPDDYWALRTEEKADRIWQTLFRDHAPVSEATRGVVAVLKAFGCPTDAPDLAEVREFFSGRDLEGHINEVFRLAGISKAVMTNDPLDSIEPVLWKTGTAKDSRFLPAMRLDRMTEGWLQHWQMIQSLGYEVDCEVQSKSTTELRRFLSDWQRQIEPVYMAVSLPDTFSYPGDQNLRTKLLKDVILPACREFDVPLALMIGVRRGANPALRLAGDAARRADLRALENLCREFPDNRFLVSVLSRENQHELCVYARKFSNLMPFGCWWFLNNPSIVEEITRERVEMLGMTFIPQHSDARILEQLIYKWHNTRRTLAPILTNSYTLLSDDGGKVTGGQIQADLNRLFRSNFEDFCRLSPEQKG